MHLMWKRALITNNTWETPSALCNSSFTLGKQWEGTMSISLFIIFRCLMAICIHPFPVIFGKGIPHYSRCRGRRRGLWAHPNCCIWTSHPFLPLFPPNMVYGPIRSEDEGYFSQQASSKLSYNKALRGHEQKGTLTLQQYARNWISN